MDCRLPKKKRPNRRLPTLLEPRHGSALASPPPHKQPSVALLLVLFLISTSFLGTPLSGEVVSCPRGSLNCSMLIRQNSVNGKRRLSHDSQASTVAGSRSAFQAHGSSRSSSCALVRPETMRSSTSVSQAKGSTPLSFAVATRLATIAQWRAPPSDPANRLFLRPRAIAQSFCPYRAGGRGPVSLARSLWSPRPLPAARAARGRADCLPRDGTRGGHCGCGVDPGSCRLRRNGARRAAGGGVGAE